LYVGQGAYSTIISQKKATKKRKEKKKKEKERD